MLVHHDDVESGDLKLKDVHLPKVEYLVKAGFTGLPLADHGSFSTSARGVLTKYIKDLVNDVSNQKCRITACVKQINEHF